MNFQDRLSTLSKSETRPTQVIDVEDSDINDLAQKVNSSGVAGSVNKSLNVYEAPRAELVKNSLAIKGYENLIQPTEVELKYVAQVFQSKKLHVMDNVTYQVISSVGGPEFVNLNNSLKVFTSKMSAVKTPGLFTLIDTLSKDIQGANLDEIWNKTVKAKPTIMARFMSLFNPSAKDESLNEQFKQLYTDLTEKGKGLEVKLGKLEGDLRKQKQQQEENIRALEQSFEIYFNSFTELRKQFILIVFLEESYRTQYEAFKLQNQNVTELSISRKLQEYEQIMEDIENRKMVIHGALLKLPITVHQNGTLVNVCKKLSKEVDSVLENSFPTIRSNLIGLGISLNSQQAMLGTQNIRELDANLSQMNMKVNSDLAVKAELLTSQSRLKDADNIKLLVIGLKDLQERTQAAKEEGRANMEQAQAVLDEATVELKQILNV